MILFVISYNERNNVYTYNYHTIFIAKITVVISVIFVRSKIYIIYLFLFHLYHYISSRLLDSILITLVTILSLSSVC
ncbi:MPPV-342 hypothetical protein [Magpiepox virus 2]|nr:MPPV-342 hypothetical protein [Magpiepox virus 2]